MGTIGILGLTGLGRTPAASHEVAACTNIDEPGRYVVTQDIRGDDVDYPDYCIEVTADDVVLDGGGHAVDTTWGGITVTGNNVTVENFGDIGEEWGLLYDGVEGGRIQNNEFHHWTAFFSGTRPGWESSTTTSAVARVPASNWSGLRTI